LVEAGIFKVTPEGMRRIGEAIEDIFVIFFNNIIISKGVNNLFLKGDVRRDIFWDLYFDRLSRHFINRN
jgi:hypothetical protein